jgi:hypothetical protein
VSKDNEVSFIFRPHKGIVEAIDTKCNVILRVSLLASSRPTDRYKWASVRVETPNDMVEVSCTPTQTNVTQTKATPLRKKTRRRKPGANEQVE